MFQTDLHSLDVTRSEKEAHLLTGCIPGGLGQRIARLEGT